MSEEMNNELNELEEVIIVTATDDDGNEVDYQEVQRLELDGKVFALLVEVTDGEEDDGDAIVARVDQEDGEDVYVAPTDEEFDAANAAFDELFFRIMIQQVLSRRKAWDSFLISYGSKDDTGTRAPARCPDAESLFSGGVTWNCHRYSNCGTLSFTVSTETLRLLPRQPISPNRPSAPR